MNKTKKLLAVVAACAMGILVCGVIGKSLLAQEKAKEKPAEAAMMAPKPGPEMDKLKFLVGNWDYNGEYKQSAMVPDGGKETGWYKAQMGPGGFSLIADFDADGPVGKEIGHEVIAWDPNENAYKSYTAGNTFPGVIAGTARWEGADLVTNSEFSFGAMKVTLRSAYKNIQANSVTIEEWSKQGDGEFQLLFTAKATRK